MKRWHYLVLGMILPLLMAAAYDKSRPKPVFTVQPEVQWENAGNLTASQSAPLVTARAFSDVWTDLTDAKTIKYVIPNWAKNVEMRFQTKADDDSHVFEIWGCPAATMVDGTEEQFTLLASLALTGGTQTGTHSNVFVDTITVTDGTWDMTAVQSTGNFICTVTVDSKGYKYIVGIASTFQASTTVYADVRFY